jgi:hypothetical protein
LPKGAIVELDQPIQHNERAVFRQLADEEGGVLLHLDTGAYHGLNPIGVVIWNAIGDESKLEDLVEAVRKSVSGVPDDLQADVVAFVEDLVQRDLLTLR